MAAIAGIIWSENSFFDSIIALETRSKLLA